MYSSINFIINVYQLLINVLLLIINILISNVFSKNQKNFTNDSETKKIRRETFSRIAFSITKMIHFRNVLSI